MERLALEDLRPLEFLELIDFSSRIETTSSDPRQYGGERDEVIPSLDEVVAWLEAGLLDPCEGETEEPFHVGRCRQQKGPDEPQAAVEEEGIDEYKPQRDAMPTAISRACAWQRESSLVPKTARSVLCPSGGGPRGK